MQSKHFSRPPARPLQPISAAWALSAANELGAEFLSWLIFDASIIRRQVAFAVFSKRLIDRVETSEHNLRALATALRDGDPRDVIAVSFGECARGQITGFSRIGRDAYADPAAYLRHHDLYTDPRHRRRLEVARHVGLLTEERLNTLFNIDPAFLTAGWVRRLTSRRARLLTQVVAAIRATALPEAGPALDMSISASDPDRSYRDAMTAWLAWCSFPHTPALNDAALGINVIQDAATLVDKARQYQNCSARLNRLIDAVAGRTVYLTYEPQGWPLAMASLLPSSDGNWLIEGIYGVKNVPVNSDDQAPLRAWLSQKGIHGVCRPPLDVGWRAALSLVGVPDEELVEFDDLNELLSVAA